MIHVSDLKVRTIFISGLPEDAKERELQNLLRWLPGYEASQVNFKGEHPMGFALFATAQHALAAKDALQVIFYALNILGSFNWIPFWMFWRHNFFSPNFSVV